MPRYCLPCFRGWPHFPLTSPKISIETAPGQLPTFLSWSFRDRIIISKSSWHQYDFNQRSKNVEASIILILNFLSISQCQKIPQGIRLRLGNHILQLETHTKTIFRRYIFFGNLSAFHLAKPFFPAAEILKKNLAGKFVNHLDVGHKKVQFSLGHIWFRN